MAILYCFHNQLCLANKPSSSTPNDGTPTTWAVRVQCLVHFQLHVFSQKDAAAGGQPPGKNNIGSFYAPLRLTSHLIKLTRTIYHHLSFFYKKLLPWNLYQVFVWFILIVRFSYPIVWHSAMTPKWLMLKTPWKKNFARRNSRVVWIGAKHNGLFQDVGEWSNGFNLHVCWI